MKQIFSNTFLQKGCTRKKFLQRQSARKKFLRAKNLDLEMWHASENFWVAGVIYILVTKKKSLNSLFNSVKIQILPIKLFFRYGCVKRNHLVYMEVGTPDR